MQLKHLKNVLPAQECMDKISAISWSPNNLKLAICTSDRVVQLFDQYGERKDKFPTKPVDPKFGKKSYVIRGLAFSPDSTKIAVGQSDNIVFVYKVGEEWGEKKVICNKFPLQSSVTCLAWPLEGPLIIGQADGKIRAAHIRSNRSQTLYTTDSFVVSIAVNTSGTGFISGHADGTIMRYYVSEESQPEPLGLVTIHKVPPYALAWPTHGFIFAGGCDGKMCIYTKSGDLEQCLDYAQEQGISDECDFNAACCSPSGQAVAVGSYNRIRVYGWSPEKRKWSEEPGKEIQNLYTVTSLAWKRDGSRIAVGTICGNVDLFETVLKRIIWKNKFELTYVGPSQVLIRRLDGIGDIEEPSSETDVILKSYNGLEIHNVKIMGPGDNYVVARTAQTILVGDLRRNLLSEIPWNFRHGLLEGETKEKFYFDNSNVCMIFTGGEMSIVEYGEDRVLASFRMEFMNPHVISIRINERQILGVREYKKLAYLMDVKTICLVDLLEGKSIGQISHDSRVDWLELDETGRRLLFRDHQLRLCLTPVPVEGGSPPTMLLPHCSYVQWVPGSDVVVAQSRLNLCIWYAIDSPERVATVPINGEVVDVVRANGKTEVVVQEGGRQLGYALDEGLVEFGTAVEDGDVKRALAYLELLDGIGGGTANEAEAMWRALASLALDTKQLHVARRCYAAIGDVAAEHYVRDLEEMEEEFIEENGEKAECYEIQARIAIFKKQFDEAELIYLENNEFMKTLNMYKTMNKWEKALALAEHRGDKDNIKSLIADWEKWMSEPGREDQVAKRKEIDGNCTTALQLYIHIGLPNQAARLLRQRPELMNDEGMVDNVAHALEKSSFIEQAGEIWEMSGDHKRALQLYRKGKIFPKAVDLARQKFPHLVVTIEEELGDYLVNVEDRPDAAIAHYIEAGQTLKALETAINARQWKKAAQIIKVFDDIDKVLNYYKIIAKHFISIKDYDTAEELLLKAKLYTEAVQMQIEAGQWEKAEKLARERLDPEEVKVMFMAQAVELEETGMLQDAERLYVLINQADLAISMYKKSKKFDQMMRLVAQYHPNLVATTHTHLGQELEAEGSYSMAEHHYLQTKDWKAAVKMYRTADLWEEAFRVAKNHGSADAAQLVAYLWGSKLGGEAAARLLVRLDLLESSIEYACENYQFEFAFEMSRIAMKEKEPEVHFKCAMALEDEGKFSEAEEHFIKAGKPREAVLMYLHGQDWHNAKRVAEKHEGDEYMSNASASGDVKPLLEEVLIAEAMHAFAEGNHPHAETLFLQAGRPDQLLDHYQEAGMWADALRVCREYLPSKLDSVRMKFERQENESVKSSVNKVKVNKGYGKTPSDMSATSTYEKALEWERGGELSRALQCYIKASDEDPDGKLGEKALHAAAKLIARMPSGEATMDAAKVLGQRLSARGQPSLAAQVFLNAEMVKEAIDVLLEAREWTKARRVAAELDPSLEEYVNSCRKESLKRAGRVDQLAEVDIDAALDLLAEQGRWGMCLDKAKSHAGEKSNLLHKYIAKYAVYLIKEKKTFDALHLYKENGIPAWPQNFGLYKKMFVGAFAMIGLPDHKTYYQWAELRDCLFQLTEAMHKDDELDGDVRSEFEYYLFASHYSATHSAFSSVDKKKFSIIISKLSVSLLRYTDIIPTDKAFYQAGTDAKEASKESLAFVLLNHYLDVVEAIEDEHDNIHEEDEDDEMTGWRSRRPAVLDASDFEGTDIPTRAPLPLNPFLDGSIHEEIKEWVLAVSVDQEVEQTLPRDKRGAFEGSLLGPDRQCSIPCIVTGYPLIGMLEGDGPRLPSSIMENTVVEFNRKGKLASREDWNKLVVAAKSLGEEYAPLRDIIRFIGEWCGGIRGASSGDTAFHF